MKTIALGMAVAFALTVAPGSAQTAEIPVGAAPKGEPNAIASRIIKYNFPSCKRVSSASRNGDGSIIAKCDGVDYLVFTVFNAKEGKTLELALNCGAAKTHFNISCFR